MKRPPRRTWRFAVKIVLFLASPLASVATGRGDPIPRGALGHNVEAVGYSELAGRPASSWRSEK